MKILKFGGSSLGCKKSFLNVFKIIESAAELSQVSIVFSAPKDTTNKLVCLTKNFNNKPRVKQTIHEIDNFLHSLIKDLSESLSHSEMQEVRVKLDEEINQLTKKVEGCYLVNECSTNSYINILSYGEKFTEIILSYMLMKMNLNFEVLNPEKIMRGQNSKLDADVDVELSKKLFFAHYSQDKNINSKNFLMRGFVAQDESGETVLLGRNGSDYSAAILAEILSAKSLEIWTDVDGIFSSDPRLVDDVKHIPNLNFKEAMELAYFGASVLHPKTIQPIATLGIPCSIRNTFNIHGKGTMIENESYPSIKGITHLNNIILINISGPVMKGKVGMTSKIFNILAAEKISIILISQASSEYSISFCVLESDYKIAKFSLEKNLSLELKTKLLDPVEYTDNLSIVTVVGDGMLRKKGIAATFLSSITETNTNIIALAQGSSERAISAVVKSEKVVEVIRACHENLFFSKHFIDVFIIGVGGVGSAFIEQVKRQRVALEKNGIVIRVIGVANSKFCYFDSKGVLLHEWQKKLSKSPRKLCFNHLFSSVRNEHVINPVIVDCTSSEFISNKYVDFFSAGCHVITPNKKASTSNYDFYKKLHLISKLHNRKFMYETTVGAGLPVIENLQNLISAGDEIEKFSGILSGSLSFIFGRIDEGVSFSQATIEAMEKGYTEPDPRDDLSGKDVARKLLILAREMGYQLELEDIKVQNILPETIVNNHSQCLEDFLKELYKVDKYFDELIAEAKSNDEVLRYVAEIENGICEVKIKPVSSSNPLYTVKNGENALAFFSKYYKPSPFVLKGYGAGNEVTAAGIFSDMMRLIR